MNQPEVWLRGSLENISPTLIAVAHALLQAREDIELAHTLGDKMLWQRPNGATSVGFHLRHIVGSLDRLLTYAKGQQLSEAQLEFLHNEAVSSFNAEQLVREAQQTIDQTINVLQSTKDTSLYEARTVGRQHLPTQHRDWLALS
ncbi:MAG: DinB family protein [Trueperaceae bacterium]